MPKSEVPILGGFYQSRSKPLSIQRCVNLVPVIPDTPNKLSSGMLYPTNGQTIFSSIAGEARGGHVMSNVPYFVFGNTLYSIDSAGVSTSIGTIEGVGLCSFADNGSYLVIVVPNGKSYTYDKATLAEITNTNFRKSDTVRFKDGYFIFTASDGDVFFNSELNDPTSYRALDFGSSEVDPDAIVGQEINHNELFIINKETIELFQNIGGADFPFQRIQGANIQKGAIARDSIIRFDDTFAFLGGGHNERPAIYQVINSATANRISTDSIDEELQRYSISELENCSAFSYKQDGQQLVAFTIESASRDSVTFVYNSTASLRAGYPVWFQNQSGIANNKWNVRDIQYAYGKMLCAIPDVGVTYLDPDTYTENGSNILREFTTLPINNNGQTLFAREMELTMESGVGLTSGQGSDPTVIMDYTDNNKHFGNDRNRSIGKKGDFKARAVWRRMGRIPYFRTFRFRVTDPVKTVMLKLTIDVAGGIDA